MLWILVSWCLVAFGQPAWIEPFGLVAVTCGYAIFWRSLLNASSKRRFVLATLFFASAQAIQLSWMTTTDYMGPLILFVYAGLCFGVGLQFAQLTHFALKEQPLRVLRCASLAGLWVLFEWVRIFVLTGFTWNPVGLGWSASILSLQGAALFGIYGLSFFAIFVNLTALRALQLRTKRSILLFSGLALFLFAFGAVRLLGEKQEGGSMTALLVQPALLPHQKEFCPPYSFEETMPAFEQWERLLKMISEVKAKPDLIVFPEAALPYHANGSVYPYSKANSIWQSYLHAPMPAPDPNSARISTTTGEIYISNAYWMQSLADHYGCDVIAGLDDRDPDGKIYNAAFHYRPGGGPVVRYEKRILLPIAEYIPLSGWSALSEFILNEYGISGSFEAGREAKIFAGKVPIGVSICYEETFSQIVREMRTKGAHLFVNLTNDGWYPRSRLSKQHFDHGIVRAVENGVPSIRACGIGVTGGVDCYGRLIAWNLDEKPQALLLEVPLSHLPTLYSFLGDWFILLVSALLSLGLFLKKNPCSK